ncbi:GNAT family N-acetyltransferase [Curtobacterium sp. MCSS17_007]|uniref:GNAT family N-acetyltransferase n=1 Tax=Curtobacterium sp. MCSS17_007 TaxID=2175646 RepID=UPI000DA9FC00|nr:GNAT family N-acetyltransferase [Curtobacterium sp. MCSS17_007]WIE76319.1 GNAT family N-acetyltransferase [Curtobacterium sp. MCSS17_007]
MEYSFAPPTAAEFQALYDETGWGAWDLERFDRALAGSWVVCSARDDSGRLVGVGRLISDGALHAFVTEMIVSEAARGQGIGGAVLARLVDESRRRGVEDVQLFAARGRAPFYEQRGFARRHEDGPGMDLVTDVGTSDTGGDGDGDGVSGR